MTREVGLLTSETPWQPVRQSGPRVLVLGLNYAPEPTGIAPYTAGLCRGLVRRGFRVRGIVAVPHYPAWRVADGYGRWAVDEVDAGVGLRRVRHYIPSSPKPLRRLLSEVTFGARLLSSRWRRFDVLVLVSPALFSSAIAMLRATLRRRPVVVWVQDFYSLGLAETGQGGSLVEKVVRRIESWLLRRADRVVVIHERFRAQAIESLGVEPERAHVVRNWTHVPPPTATLGRAPVADSGGVTTSSSSFMQAISA